MGWLSKKSRQNNEEIEDVSLFKDSDVWFRKDVRFAISNILSQIENFDSNKLITKMINSFILTF